VNFKDIPVVIPYEQSISSLDGLLELDEVEDRYITAHFTVLDRLKQPFGLVHGGVFSVVAESLASFGTYMHAYKEGKAAVGMSNNTSFFRSIKEGQVRALAKVRHSGRTTWVWEVEFTNENKELCALATITVAIR